MICTINKVNNFTTVDIKISETDKKRAIEKCNQIADVLGEHISNDYKYELVSQTSETYFFTITYEIFTNSIEMDIEATGVLDLQIMTNRSVS